MTRHRRLNMPVIGRVLAVLLLAAIPLRASAAPPQDIRRQAIALAFAALSDNRPATRAMAHHALLGLPAEDLPTLRDIVQQARPLTPEQSDALHDIVVHVFLAGQSYLAEGNVGFLGVSFDLYQQSGEELEGGGVEIRNRLPGFCAYQNLETGDVLLSVQNSSGVHELHTCADIMQTIRECPAGQVVRFKVLRRGKVEYLNFPLSARPLESNDQFSSGFTARRMELAETYWEDNFAALVDD